MASYKSLPREERLSPMASDGFKNYKSVMCKKLFRNSSSSPFFPSKLQRRRFEGMDHVFRIWTTNYQCQS